MFKKQRNQSLVLRILIAAALLSFLSPTAVLAVNTCGPIYSPGNPYPCQNGGNCTFYAWHMSKTVWGQAMPGFGKNAYYPSGDAKYWAGQASSAGWPVSAEPGSRTVAVSSTRGTNGHVWWVNYLSSNTTVGSEMNWNVWGVKSQVQYPFSTANKGYIYPKQMWWRPMVDFTVSSTLWVKSYDQRIGFSGRNFGPDMVVDVTFPSGAMTTLRGSQVQYSSGSYFSILVTLGARGWWKFRAVARDGQRSNPVWVYVN